MSASVVDAHMHLYPDAEWGARRMSDHAIVEYGDGVAVGTRAGSGDIADGVAALDRAGAGVGLAFNLFEPARIPADLTNPPSDASVSAGSTAGEYLCWLNEWICRAARNTALIRPVVAADPIALPGRSLAEHLDRMVAAGAVGVKIHHAFQRLAPDDPRLDVLYALCVDLQVPLVAHSGWAMPPNAFDRVLRRWSALSLVLAHAGGAAWRTARTLAAAHPHATFDLAEILWWLDAPLAPSADAFVAFIRAIGIDRVIFGSDFPWYEPKLGVDRIRGLRLSPEEEAAVLGGNASRVFALE
jgi:uncharacterized protein